MHALHTLCDAGIYMTYFGGHLFVSVAKIVFQVQHEAPCPGPSVVPFFAFSELINMWYPYPDPRRPGKKITYAASMKAGSLRLSESTRQAMPL